MAMIKTDGIEIQGKVGGDVFRSDQCGPHIQASPRDIEHEPTQKQRLRRLAFRACIDYIRTHATLIWVSEWQIYANEHPKKTCKGKIYALAWWQQFVSYNINRIIAGEPIIDLPPI